MCVFAPHSGVEVFGRSTSLVHLLVVVDES